MTNLSVREFEKINGTQMSCTRLKKHLTEMLANSAQCKAILECINHDTGEYRIVLEGVLENE